MITLAAKCRMQWTGACPGKRLAIEDFCFVGFCNKKRRNDPHHLGNFWWGLQAQITNQGSQKFPNSPEKGASQGEDQTQKDS